MTSNVERAGNQRAQPLPVARSGSMRTQKLTWRALFYILITIGAVASMIPFFWTVVSSGKNVNELYRYPPTMWPENPQFIANYTQILTEYPFGIWFRNSFWVTFWALLGTIVSATLVAYGFARFRIPGREVFFFITLATIMLPVEVTLIPTYLLFKELDWINTYKPLIIPAWFGGGAFNIFLMRQFIMGIPYDLDEAAKLDGASSWRILWQVIVPLCKPAIATMATLGFIGQWNNFLYPLIFLNSEDKYVVAVGLRYLQTAVTQGSGAVSRPQDHLLMGAALMVALPCLILFFLGQRYFVQGIVTTGIKG
jgi:multiple sugar transport system permease protein/sn-glycerol 3-phosphate transport system permease protein